MYEIIDIPGTANTVKARGKCRITGETYETQPFCAFAWCEWCFTAAHIQETRLAELSADDREFLISGTSPKGWNKMFNIKDDES